MAASRTDFWGIELTGKKKEEVWNGEDDEEDESDPDIISTLHIQRVILGANAKDDEANLVTVTAENTKGEEITHPLAWLKKKPISEAQCSMHIALPPPVTFKLAQGSGPVHVIGVWEQQIDDDFSFSDEESEGDGNEMMDDDEITSPGKVKAIVAPPKAAKDIETKPSKKRPADTPPAKAAKVAKKDESSKKSNLPQFRLPDKDEEESDEDEEKESEEDDDDDDNDFGEEDEEDSDDEEEEESEEEAPPPKIKSKQMMKAGTPKQKVTAANTPKSIGDKPKKTPKTTPGAPLTFDQLKAKLAKSPNIPKKRDKFNNYIRNNLKVTDAEMTNKLWTFVQQNKH